MNKGIAVLARPMGASQWQMVSPRYSTRSMSHAKRIAAMYVNEWGWEACIAPDGKPLQQFEPRSGVEHADLTFPVGTFGGS